MAYFCPIVTMEVKKSKKADLEGKRVYFFLLGFFLSAGLLWIVLEWKYREKPDQTASEETPVDHFVTLDEEIVITHQAYTLHPNEPLPLLHEEPNQTRQQAELFEIVDNNSHTSLHEALSFEEFKAEEQLLHPSSYDFLQEAASLDAKAKSDSLEDVLYTRVEELPEFPGGYAAFIRYLGKTIRYPQPSVVQQVKGRVVCSFIIDKTGRIEQVGVVEGLDPSLDREVVRAINNMPAWKPGKNHGKVVRVKFIVPVSFRL